MSDKQFRQGVWLVCGIVAALYLTVAPLPLRDEMRPDFMALLVIYQALYRSERMSLGLAFLLGLSQDILLLSLLGQHALGLTVLCFLTNRFRSRLYLSGPVVQAPLVLTLLIVLQLINAWIYAIGFSQMLDIRAMVAPFISVLCWIIMVWPLAPATRIQQQFSR
jgi:rod shape-determining protein MreD